MTGAPTEYGPADLEILLDQMGDIDEDAEGFEVECDLEWSGEFNPQPRRTLRAGIEGRPYNSLNLDKVRAAKRVADLARAVKLKTPARASSYRATSWQAQYAKLRAHGQGAAAQAAVGFNPSARSIRRWLNSGAAPSRANQARISAAYEHLATSRARDAAEKASWANQALGAALNEALEERYGAPVRIFRAGPFEWS